MSGLSRIKHLEKTLAIKGDHQSLRAMDMIKREMNAEKGFIRKGSGEDYYYHCIDVAQYILNILPGIDNDTITAALLHDIMEDVEGYTKEMLAELFNDNVAEIVDGLTKSPGVDYKTDHQAMAQYVDRIASNASMSIVKTADRVHNFRTLDGMTSKHRHHQVDNTLKYYIPLFKTSRNNYPRYAGFFIIAQNIIEPIAREIKRNLEMEDIKNAEIERLTQLLNKGG